MGDPASASASRQNAPDDLESLPASRQFLQSVLDAQTGHSAILDAAGTIIAVNAAWRRFARANGYAGTAYGLGASYLAVCEAASGDRADQAPEVARGLRALIAGERAHFEIEYPCHAPGDRRWFRLRAARFEDDGRIYIVADHLNITEQCQAEQELRRYADRLKLLHQIDREILAAQSPEQIGAAVLNHIHQVVDCRRPSIILFDFERQQVRVLAAYVDGAVVMGAGTRRLISVQELPEIGAAIDTLRRGQVYALDLLALPSDLPMVQTLLAEGLRAFFSVPVIAQGELIGSLQVGMADPAGFGDESLEVLREAADSVAVAMHQAQLFEQVRAGRERLRELSRRLVAAQELERRQIARDFHDHFGQIFAVLNIHLGIVRDQLAPDMAASLDARLGDIQSLIDDIADRVRDMLARLRPSILDDYGLPPALRWHVQRFAAQTALEIAFHADDLAPEARLAPEVETALFRVAQEALTNVVKHAGATHATVTLTIDDRRARLVVADDGAGFDPHGPPERGMGLIGMRERMEAIGGTLLVESAPRAGARIIAEVGR